ncbi:MAG TPA: NIPSNAP family containing protein [Myxococcota bacterium]|jgi:hypothetical protein|nr:NIPSNAP family containing protein [Myxococcota bacterium]
MPADGENVANEKVYIHELIDIIGHGRAKYMHHMTANWCPIGRAERGQLCFGVWGTVGSTGRWPEVVNLWEEPGWDGLAASFAHETGHPSLQDPSLAAWWAEAAKYRSGGLDRILVPAPWMRTIDELCRDGVRCGAFTAHEIVQVATDGTQEFLERVRDVGAGAYAAFGLELLGAFRTVLRDDAECVLLWKIPRATDWSRFERAQDGDAGLARWRDAVRGLALSWRRTLLVDAPLSPLRTGRQPQESDRKPLDEIR